MIQPSQAAVTYPRSADVDATELQPSTTRRLSLACAAPEQPERRSELSRRSRIFAFEKENPPFNACATFFEVHYFLSYSITQQIMGLKEVERSPMWYIFQLELKTLRCVTIFSEV